MRNFSLYRGIVAVPAVMSALLMVSCSGDATGADQEEPASQDSDVEDQGLLMGEGYAQEEQLQEVETVLGVMREHFGEAHFTDLGEDATVEDFEAEVRPQSCGEDHYRYRVGFELEERDEPELYQRAESAAAELGLTENENNGDGSDGGPMLYGAGIAEDRLFSVTTEGGQLSAIYRGRCSDHQTMQDKAQEFADDYAEQMEENAPTHLPGYGE